MTVGTHHLVFKTELRVNDVQRSAFASHFGATRFAYNCLLGWTVEEYEKHKLDPTYPRPSLTQKSLQTTWARILRDKYAPWHREHSQDPYRHAAACLADAYRGFFTNGGSTGRHPKFKRKGCQDSYATDGRTSKLKDSGRIVKVPIIGDVRLHERLRAADWLQRMGGLLQEVTYSRDATGRIYASFRYRVIASLALVFFRSKFHRKGSGFAGVDLGITTYAVMSNKTVISNPAYYRKLEAKLARSQRVLTRKKLAARRAKGQPKSDSSGRGRGSKSHERARLRVNQIHRRTRNLRREFLNKTARSLVIDYTTLVIEDLDVAGMKTHHGKSVSDVSPAEFRRILTYMGERYGTQVIVADRYFPSSKTCSGCGTVKAKLSLKERQYECAVCGLSLDRDFNAALNLEKWGRDYLTQQLPSGETDALRCSESLNGRGPEDLIASDQSQRKAAGASHHQSVNASHEPLVASRTACLYQTAISEYRYV